MARVQKLFDMTKGIVLQKLFSKTVEDVQNALISPVSVYYDMGSRNTRIALAERGVITCEKTALIRHKYTGEYTAFGTAAFELFGKTDEMYEGVLPIVDGAVADPEALTAFLEFLYKSQIVPYLSRRGLWRSRVRPVIARSPLLTRTQATQFTDLFHTDMYAAVASYDAALALVASSAEAAIPAKGFRCTVSIGYGQSHVAITQNNLVLRTQSIPLAVACIEQDVSSFLQKKYSAIFSPNTILELVETHLELTYSHGTPQKQHHSGKLFSTGLPHTFSIESSELYDAVNPTMQKLVSDMKGFLSSLDAALLSEVTRHGLRLAGGFARNPQLAPYLEKQLQLPVTSLPKPDEALVLGLVEYDRNLMESV